jgi:PAS domain-containing protein
LLKETGKSLFEVALKRKDGTPVYVILNATKLPEEKMMAFCENITERKKAEQALVEAKDRNQSYLDIADVMIVVISPDQNTVLANKKTFKALGYSEDEILNKNWFDAVAPEANRPSIKKSFSDISLWKN